MGDSDGDLYFRAVIDVWNELARSESVRELSPSKYRFPPRIFMRPTQGRYSLIERILRLYSVLFLSGGGFTWLYVQLRHGMDPLQLIALSSILMGVFALLLSTSGFFGFIRGQARDRDDRSE